MTNVVEQIQHPLIEEMQARYEVEIAEVRKQKEEVEAERDEWQEKAEGADDSVFREREFLEEITWRNNPETGKKERRELTISEFQQAIEKRRKPRWNGEYGVLDDLAGMLDYLKAERTEVRYETVEKVREVERLPATLTINGKNYHS